MNFIEFLNIFGWFGACQKKGFRDTIIGVNSAFDSSAKYQFKSQFGKNAKILAAKEIWRSTLKLFKC